MICVDCSIVVYVILLLWTFFCLSRVFFSIFVTVDIEIRVPSLGVFCFFVLIRLFLMWILRGFLSGFSSGLYLDIDVPCDNGEVCNRLARRNGPFIGTFVCRLETQIWCCGPTSWCRPGLVFEQMRTSQLSNYFLRERSQGVCRCRCGHVCLWWNSCTKHRFQVLGCKRFCQGQRIQGRDLPPTGSLPTRCAS